MTPRHPCLVTPDWSIVCAHSHNLVVCLPLRLLDLIFVWLDLRETCRKQEGMPFLSFLSNGRCTWFNLGQKHASLWKRAWQLVQAVAPSYWFRLRTTSPQAAADTRWRSNIFLALRSHHVREEGREHNGPLSCSCQWASCFATQAFIVEPKANMGQSQSVGVQ